MQRGVNLGGWFIPEKWMTPSLFAETDAVDLWTLLETPAGKQRYRRHLETWLTEADFAWLAAHNVTLLRLPVGYWAVASDARFPDVSAKVAWAFQMAKTYRLKILLDFHAAKGSQNGHDHSARIGPVEWWHYEAETYTALEALAAQYGAHPALWGIELLNEPAVGWHYWRYLRFCRRAYTRLQTVLPAGKIVVFHDGFMPLLLAGALWPRRNHPVVMDMHLYGLPAVFGASEARYMWWQRLYFRGIIRYTRWFQPVMIGEWSGVVPQRLFDLSPEQQQLELVGRNIARQQRYFASTTAACYWNYKTEASGVWNYRSLVEAGVLR